MNIKSTLPKNSAQKNRKTWIQITADSPEAANFRYFHTEMSLYIDASASLEMERLAPWFTPPLL